MRLLCLLAFSIGGLIIVIVCLAERQSQAEYYLDRVEECLGA